MVINLVVKPNEIKEGQKRITVVADGFLPYTAAYIGAYTYCCGLMVDNGAEFEIETNQLHHNLQIGKYNSIGNDMQCILGRNHNYMNVSTGAVQLMLQENNVKIPSYKTSFNNKGMIIIQNDVWFGENVTVMPGVIIRNGAVIARNSHVVSDVPPYAIVGGNPAKIIGYRYTPEQIEKLQMIAWWDWKNEKIIENATYFTEDIDGFCDTFFLEAKQEFENYMDNRTLDEDAYFVFVDYYENYGVISSVIEAFLDEFIGEKKKLFLFIQEDERTGKIDASYKERLEGLVDAVNAEPGICCSLELAGGSIEDAKTCFLNCSHYIATRTFDTVCFSCLADRLGMEIISGVDSKVVFRKREHMWKF